MKLEVHEHCFVSGSRARSWDYKFEHSHEGGDGPHRHEHTGPASYTIDKDDWFARTGLKGGGRKSFTSRPKGEQLPTLPLEAGQGEFEVVMTDPPSVPPGFDGQGGGHVAMERMLQAHRMRAHVRVVKG